MKSDTINKLNSVLGVTDQETVKLDFDRMSISAVEYWASRMLHWFKLEGFVILKSSEGNYHVVFNRPVSWEENVGIMAWCSLQNFKNAKIVKWFVMQCIKKGSTLRLSRKGNKPYPRIVLRFGKQDRQIKVFVRSRKLVRSIVHKLENEQSSLDSLVR